jgi:hypothetical protein
MKHTGYYHYTSELAFQEIIKTGKIYASHHTILNDKYELSFCRTLISSEFEIILQEETLYGLNAFLKGLMNQINHKFDSLSVFVFSLSQESDNLAQWYAYGAQCKGFSICFKMLNDLNIISIDDIISQKRTTALENPYNKWFIAKVMYYDNNLEAKIREYIQGIYKKFRSMIQREIINNNNNFSTIYKSMVDEIIYSLSLIIACVKNKYFEFEKEIRIVYLIDSAQNEYFNQNDINDKIHFRTIRNKLSPYIELTINEHFSLNDVIIGPLNYSDITHINSFLRKYSFENAIVTKSEIPINL